jgi:hypothetical protein
MDAPDRTGLDLGRFEPLQGIRHQEGFAGAAGADAREARGPCGECRRAFTFEFNPQD